MRMRAINKDVYIATDRGTAIIIGTEFRDIPIEFRREALMRSEEIEIEGIKSSDLNPVVQTPYSKEARLKDIVKAMIVNIGLEEGLMTGSGLPNMNKLKERAGYNVSREEMIMALEDAKSEIEKEDTEE